MISNIDQKVILAIESSLLLDQEMHDLESMFIIVCINPSSNAPCRHVCHKTRPL